MTAILSYVIGLTISYIVIKSLSSSPTLNIHLILLVQDSLFRLQKVLDGDKIKMDNFLLLV